MTQRTIKTPTKPAQEAKPLAGNSEAKEFLKKALYNKKLSDLPTSKERLLAVADAIEHAALVEKDIGFNMEVYVSTGSSLEDQTGHHCGTVACIAGWANLLEDAAKYRDESINHPREAARLLMLDDNTAFELFSGFGTEHYPNYDEDDEEYLNVTTAHAVAVIRHLAETGDVKWHGFDENGKPVTP